MLYKYLGCLNCFSVPIICASGCLFFDMRRSPSEYKNHIPSCAEIWDQVIGIRGAGLGQSIRAGTPPVELARLCRTVPHSVVSIGCPTPPMREKAAHEWGTQNHGQATRR